uniref:Uncharacterized protein n=1 Tax=Rhizophora mucronata TaxID=61149 RepID=A0A2P2PA15_RHIMU
MSLLQVRLAISVLQNLFQNIIEQLTFGRPWSIIVCQQFNFEQIAYFKWIIKRNLPYTNINPQNKYIFDRNSEKRNDKRKKVEGHINAHLGHERKPAPDPKKTYDTMQLTDNH